MALSLTKPGGWSLNEKLTSAQITDLDNKSVKSLDKTVSGDTLAGLVACTGVGRIVPTSVVGADADTTYTWSDGISEIRIPSSLTAARIYTISVAGATTGDVVMVKAAAALTFVVTVKDGGGATIATVSGSAPAASAVAGHQVVTLLFNGTAWEFLTGWNAGPRILRVTANGSFVVPPGVYSVALLGSGGGGGGGGGDTHGGGGGAAAPPGSVPLAVTPLETLDHFIGAGGAAAAINTIGNPGGRTYVQRAAVDIASFPGGIGGGVGSGSPGASGAGPYFGGNYISVSAPLTAAVVPGSIGTAGTNDATTRSGGGAAGLGGSGGNGGSIAFPSGSAGGANTGSGGGGGGAGTASSAGGSGLLFYIWS